MGIKIINFPDLLYFTGCGSGIYLCNVMRNRKIESSNINNNTLPAVYATKGDNPGEINLQWDSINEATGYVVQVSKLNGKKYWKHFDIVSESFCTVSGLKTNCTHLFRVATVSRKGQSKWSSEISKKL